MPTITMQNPLDVAGEAVGAYLGQKRTNELDAQARAQQQRQIDAQIAAQQAQQRNADARTALDQAKFAYDQGRDKVVDAREQARLVLEAKREADTALHQARLDAIAALRERNTQERDDKKFALEVAKVNQQYKIEKMKLSNAQTVAQIHAQATMGAAQIHASATIQAAGMREDGANAREASREQNARDMLNTRTTTTQRGQDLTHGDRVTARTAAKKARVASAVLTLSRNPRAPKPPQDDPKFNEAMQRFLKATPAERDAFVADPKVPASTRAYFQALGPLLEGEDGE